MFATPSNVWQGFLEGQGGAIFTIGEIVVRGEASFGDNASVVSDVVQYRSP